MAIVKNRFIFQIIISLVFVSLIIQQPTKGICFMKRALDKDEEKLLQNIDEFNKSIKDKGWNLNNRIVKQKDISGIHLVNSVWKNVDVIGSKCVSSRFEGCTFKRVEFSEANISKSVFRNCKFLNCEVVRSKFNMAKFVNCRFSESKFKYSDFNESIWENSGLDDIKAMKVDWRYARLRNTTFNKGEYEEVAFSDSHLNNVIFSHSKLIRSGFSGSEIEQCNFEIEGNVVNFVDVKCNHLRITGSPTIHDLKLAGLKGDSILIEKLKSSEFFAMSFAEVNNFHLKNSELSFTSCVSASFSNTIFQNISFNFAQFDNSRFKNVSFDKVTFSGELIFDGATFENTKFVEIKKSNNYEGSYENTVFEGKEPF